MRSFDYTPFENRLKKMDKHFSKWARRQGITCFRVFDADIPDFQLLIDRYGDAVYVAELATSGSEDETPDSEEERLWRAGLRRVIHNSLVVPLELIFFKKRARQKGTAQYVKLDSSANEREVQEDGLKFIINLSDYLDTGLFLDHRQTRKMARGFAEKRHCLNLFAYTGAFSVYMAAGGAKSTTTVDLSNTYTTWAQRNMALNGFQGPNHQFVTADVMRWLEEIEPLKYDLAILDPPTFSNSKKMLGILDVQRDHAWMIRQVLRGLRPGGILLFSTNFRRFKLNEEAFDALTVKEITGQTIPQDFRNEKIHRCWDIRK